MYDFVTRVNCNLDSQKTKILLKFEYL